MKSSAGRLVQLAVWMAVAVAPACLFGVEKCTAGGKEGTIGYETHAVPNFKGELVYIVVEHCKVGSTYYLTGYTKHALAIKDPFGMCSGMTCRTPADGVAALRNMQARMIEAAGKLGTAAPSAQVEGKPLSAALTEALAKCPPTGHCQLPAPLVSALRSNVKLGTEATQLATRHGILLKGAPQNGIRLASPK